MRCNALLIALLLSMLGCKNPAPKDELYSMTAWSNDKRYRVSIRPEPLPIPLNELFTIEGQVIDGVNSGRESGPLYIEVDAGMPAHRHGMNTTTTVELLGAGRFRASGLQFHMLGAWQIYVDVTSSGVTERTQFDVVLE